jgi:hypothetical protein
VGTSNEPRSNGADVAAIGWAVTMGANGDEVTRPMGSNRQQLRGWIAAQDDRKEGADKSAAKSLDPMLER